MQAEAPRTLVRTLTETVLCVSLSELFDVGVVGHGDAYFNVAVKGSCVVDKGANLDSGNVGPFDAGHA